MFILEKYITDLMTDKILGEIAQRYGTTLQSLVFLRDFENFVYEFEKENHAYILRISHSSHRTESLIHEEAMWIKYLHDHNARVSNVICSTNGRLVETIKTGDSSFLATVFEKAPGKEVDRQNPEEWNEALFETWGQVVGNFHRLSKLNDPILKSIQRFHWYDDDLVKNAEKYLAPVSKAAIEKHKQLVDWMHQLPTGHDSYGLVHTDVHDGNFFVHHSQMTVFDFDDCRFDWYANDVAIVLFYVLFGARNLEKGVREKLAYDFMRSFLQGYRKENTITQQWLDCIPKFLKFRELLVFTVLCKKWNLSNLNERQQQLIDLMIYNIENDIPYQ